MSFVLAIRIAPTVGVTIVAVLLSTSIYATNAMAHDQDVRQQVAAALPPAKTTALPAGSSLDELDALLAASADTVLDRKVLETVAAHAKLARAALVALTTSTEIAKRALKRSAFDGAWDGSSKANQDLLSQLASQRRQVSSNTLTLASDTAAIQAAVVAWRVEQARIAAVKAEAARVAAELAAAAANAAAQDAAAVRHPGQSAVASTESKDDIARAVFARFGFGSYSFNTGQSQGHWGATDLDNQLIYLQLSLIPYSRVAWVAKHEFGHIVQARTYGGYDATVAHFGSVSAMEADADAFASSH